MKEKAPLSINDYIQQYPKPLSSLLQQCKETIQQACPQATQKMSWGMPTFYLHGNLVHFAMNKHHLGFYPGETGVAHFKDRLEKYKCSKGAIQFLLDQPIPFDLIEEIVNYRTQENLDWYQQAQQRKKEEKNLKNIRSLFIQHFDD